MNNGISTMAMKIYMYEQGKIIPCKIHIRDYIISNKTINNLHSKLYLCMGNLADDAIRE